MEHKIVEVKNLSHRYTVNWAIKDINFEIEKNGVFGLLGSNGAGEVHDDEHHLQCFDTDPR